jgi:hypothetical protein
MGTWQSAVSVRCCSLEKRDDDDVLSDGDQGEDKGTREASAVCVAHPLSWHHGSGSAPPPHAPPRGMDEISLPRSISHATTIPVGLTR